MLCSRRLAKADLLNDWRRVNVAFTRAKKKIIVIGSINYMKDNINMKKFVEIMIKNRSIYNIEKQNL